MKLKEKNPASFRCSVSIVNCQDLFIGHTFFYQTWLKIWWNHHVYLPQFYCFPPNSKTDKIITLSVHVFQSCPIAYKNILTNVYKNMTLHPFTDRQKALIDNTLFQFCRYASIHGLNFRCITDWRIEITKKISKLNVWNLKPLSHFQQDQL